MSLTKYSTLWLVRTIAVLAFVSVVTSCGFKPLYAKKEKGSNYKACTNFVVSKLSDFGVAGQRLQYNLQDDLNQACVNEGTDYRVVVEVKRSKEATLIQKDREVTRYNLNFTSSFAVREVSTDKLVYNGTSSMVGGFDAQVSDYGTYALEQDTEKKLLEELANDIALKISSSLLRKK